MAEDDQGDKGAMPGPRSRRARPTPTIDLTATEVAAEKTDQAEAQPHASSPVGDEPKAEAEAAASDAPPSPSSRIGGYLVAGAAGAVLVAIVAVALALGGYVPMRTVDNSALKSQLAALQSQIEALADRAPVADQQTVGRLAQRLDKIEQAASKPSSDGVASDAALSDRMAAVETSVKTITASTAALSQRAQSAAEAATAAAQKAGAATQALDDFRAKQAAALDAVTKRLDALEESAKATQDKVASQTGSDAAARRALATFALRDAVTRGAPYATELSAAKALGANPKDIAALEPFAASGVPDDARMAADLKALLPDMIKAAGTGTARPDGFIAKLEANAGRLVRIRPAGEPAGDAPSAVLARIEAKLAHDDIAGAAGELDKLPDKVRAVAAPWRKTFDQRQAAISASNKLAADSAGALAAR
ncbi:MAG: hypothetical protein OJF62_001666 [Pseudolabrys sp.]|jgi:hypothetical protein|nr:hypothetical protein [Pseudolabrys sp.]